jgi:hypothetical protein
MPGWLRSLKFDRLSLYLIDLRSEPNLIPITQNVNLRRGGWLLTGRVDGDTDAVARNQNWRHMAKSAAGSLDPEWREVFNGASPTNDHQATGLDFAHMINHQLQKHVNVILDATGAAGSPDGIITDTDIDTANSTLINRYTVSKSGNAWRTLQQIAAGEFYNIWVDRHNKIWYGPRPSFAPAPPASKGLLTTSHMRGTLQVKYWNSRPGQRIGQVSITTIKDSTTVFKSTYPVEPADGKILPSKDGFWAASQANSDTLAERLYRWLTRAYTLTVEVDPGLAMFGDDGVGLDLGDRLTFNYDGPAEDADTGAGVHLLAAAQPMYVYGMQIPYDVVGRLAKVVLTLEYDNS